MLEKITRLFLYRKKLVKPYADLLLKVVNMVTLLCSLFFIVTVLFEYGFIVSSQEHEMIHAIYRFSLRLFVAGSVLNFLLDFWGTVRRFGLLAWVVTILLYTTAIPIFFAEPIGGIWEALYSVFGSGIYQAVVLGTLSVLHLSNSFVRLLGTRANPSLIFSASFLVIILVGAGLLMLPRATYEQISFIDALFTSTSAACVTGLSTVDVASVFTPIGLTFIMILIQIGGLGVMTLTSFFALFFMGNTSLSNQTLISDMVSSKSLGSLLSTLLYILIFTVVIELIGAALIFVNIHSTLGMTLREELAFSIFHSISAFCNAGFSTMPGNLSNEMLMTGHNSFYLTISALVVLGGIGFPILVNLYSWIKYTVGRLYTSYVKRTFEVERQVHIYDVNTKIVVAMTLSLLALGALAVGALEWNGALDGMAVTDKIVHSLFSSVSPRTAGFSSVNMMGFGTQTLLVVLFLMVIGGGSQSTAGGIKVNTFAVIMYNIKAILQGRDSVTLFNRSISNDSIRRSNSTLVIYLFFIFVSVFLIAGFEPSAPLLSVIFEAVSALSTVGATLDLTPTLGSDSKVVVICLMFVGRVGVLTMMASIIRQKGISGVRYPSGNILIN